MGYRELAVLPIPACTLHGTCTSMRPTRSHAPPCTPTHSHASLCTPVHPHALPCTNLCSPCLEGVIESWGFKRIPVRMSSSMHYATVMSVPTTEDAIKEEARLITRHHADVGKDKSTQEHFYKPCTAILKAAHSRYTCGSDMRAIAPSTHTLPFMVVTSRSSRPLPSRSSHNTMLHGRGAGRKWRKLGEGVSLLTNCSILPATQLTILDPSSATPVPSATSACSPPSPFHCPTMQSHMERPTGQAETETSMTFTHATSNPPNFHSHALVGGLPPFIHL